jgi:hypothetical protein
VPEPETVGDLGASCAPDPSIRLLARAVRESWPMSDATRARVLAQLEAVLANDKGMTSPREIIAACRAMIAADRLNLDQERLDQARADDAGTALDALAEAEAADRAYDAESPDR